MSIRHYSVAGVWGRLLKLSINVLVPHIWALFTFYPHSAGVLFVCLFACLFFVLLCCLRGQRQCKWGRGRRRGRENPKQAPHCQCRARHRAQTHETMRSWLELKPRIRPLLSHPGTLPPVLQVFRGHVFHWTL